eukprot:TRINITY_DN108_c0_g1_i1.p1 TRINITY_DN108_c0_g1~~TRINITY_DN108_c0_g1_i1.p1  ORF type:complete len:1388 (+),score=374.60 TRINITY_DN108_c0_g1_i1:4964-9127(+)
MEAYSHVEIGVPGDHRTYRPLHLDGQGLSMRRNQLAKNLGTTSQLFLHEFPSKELTRFCVLFKWTGDDLDGKDFVKRVVDLIAEEFGASFTVLHLQTSFSSILVFTDLGLKLEDCAKLMNYVVLRLLTDYPTVPWQDVIDQSIFEEGGHVPVYLSHDAKMRKTEESSADLGSIVSEPFTLDQKEGEGPIDHSVIFEKTTTRVKPGSVKLLSLPLNLEQKAVVLWNSVKDIAAVPSPLDLVEREFGVPLVISSPFKALFHSSNPGIQSIVNKGLVQANQEFITQFAAGSEHIAILVVDGSVYTFGSGQKGRLGRADSLGTEDWIPRKVKMDRDRVTQISAAGSHTAILTESGVVYVFGGNHHGEAGLDPLKRGDTGKGSFAIPVHEYVVEPTAVSIVEDDKNVRVQFVSCGDAHMAAVSENGDLYMWGENSAGQLGVRDRSGYLPTPQKVPRLKKIKLVSCGGGPKDGFTIAVSDHQYHGDDVFVFGLFMPTIEPEGNHVSRDVVNQYGGLSFLDLGVGVFRGIPFGCLLTEDGRVFFVHANPDRDGDHFPHLDEVAFFRESDMRVFSIHCSNSFVATVTDYGHVYLWGDFLRGSSDANIFDGAPVRFGEFEDYAIREVLCLDSVMFGKGILALAEENLTTRDRLIHGFVHNEKIYHGKLKSLHDDVWRLKEVYLGNIFPVHLATLRKTNKWLRKWFVYPRFSLIFQEQSRKIAVVHREIIKCAEEVSSDRRISLSSSSSFTKELVSVVRRLDEPCQRIAFYEHFFRNLLENTPPSHEDSVRIREIISFLESYSSFLYRDREKYIGRFDDQGYRSGWGECTYPNSDKYFGVFVQGEPDAFGLYQTHETLHLGVMRQGSLEGFGVMKKLTENEVFVGSWNNKKPHGLGVFILQSGEIFVGNFDHGRINGDGCLRMRGGNVIRGRFTAPKDVTKKSVLSVDRLNITNATFTTISGKDREREEDEFCKVLLTPAEIRREFIELFATHCKGISTRERFLRPAKFTGMRTEMCEDPSSAHCRLCGGFMDLASDGSREHEQRLTFLYQGFSVHVLCLLKFLRNVMPSDRRHFTRLIEQMQVTPPSMDPPLPPSGSRASKEETSIAKNISSSERSDGQRPQIMLSTEEYWTVFWSSKFKDVMSWEHAFGEMFGRELELKIKGIRVGVGDGHLFVKMIVREFLGLRSLYSHVASKERMDGRSTLTQFAFIKAFTKFVFHECHLGLPILAIYDQCYAKENQEFNEAIARLHHMRPSDMSVEGAFSLETEESPYHEAITIMKNLEEVTNPFEILDVLQLGKYQINACWLSYFHKIGKDPKIGGGDQTKPLFWYCLLQAGVKNLYSKFRLVLTWIDHFNLLGTSTSPSQWDHEMAFDRSGHLTSIIADVDALFPLAGQL